jgi:hypothetical protein
MHVENRERLVRLETIVEALVETSKDTNAKVTSLIETRSLQEGAWKFTRIVSHAITGLPGICALLYAWLK